MSVFREKYILSNGNTLFVDAKRFGNEIRVYRIYGDVTDTELLEELAQVISCETGAEKVVLTL